MRPERHPAARPYARGFSLVSALFLIIVLAGLGALMVSLSGVQHHSAMLGVQGSRALAAAQTGIEWGSYQALVNSSCEPSETFSLSEGALSGFSVTVSCSATTHQETSNNYLIYVIGALASTGSPGDPGYAARQMNIKVTNAPDT